MLRHKFLKYSVVGLCVLMLSACTLRLPRGSSFEDLRDVVSLDALEELVLKVQRIYLYQRFEVTWVLPLAPELNMRVRVRWTPLYASKQMACKSRKASKCKALTNKQTCQKQAKANKNIYRLKSCRDNCNKKQKATCKRKNMRLKAKRKLQCQKQSLKKIIERKKQIIARIKQDVEADYAQILAEQLRMAKEIEQRVHKEQQRLRRQLIEQVQRELKEHCNKRNKKISKELQKKSKKSNQGA